MVPKKVFFTCGVGSGKMKLQSFESALRDAGIAQFNLVEVSSILPPNCIEITKDEGLNLLEGHAGAIVFIVLARKSTNIKGEKISASVGAAKPENSNSYGYLSEYKALGQNKEKTSLYAEDLAASMLASILGIPFDPDSSLDEKREIFKKSKKIIETKSITSCALNEKEGNYITVVSAAVFIID